MIFNKMLIDGWPKCIGCNLEFVNRLTDPISNADAHLYSNVHVILKLGLKHYKYDPVHVRCFRRLKTWCRATLIENRLCRSAMLHRNDTVGQVNPEAVLKRWNSSGNRKIHLAFTD